MPMLIIELNRGREVEAPITNETLRDLYRHMQAWLHTANLTEVGKRCGISRQALTAIRDNNINIGIDRLGAIFDVYHQMRDQ